MLRSLILAALVSTVAAGAAQAAGGPPIAYIKAGSAQQIYLVNPDGTGLTRVYTAPRKTGLGSPDLKPGGGELAFVEQLGIKIQKLAESGQPDGAATPLPGAPCNFTQSPDYHPSGDGRFVFIAACGFGNFQVMTYKSGDAAPTLLFTLGGANRIRWSRSGDHLIYDEAESATSSAMRLKRRNVATAAIEDFGALSALDTFDVARTGERLAFGSQQAPRLFDFASMSDTSQAAPLCPGDDIHFSPDDTQIVYETPHSARGTYIQIKASDCSGSASSLTGKGDWHDKDWRPDPVLP